MKLSCRIGFHDWGKWSNYWVTTGWYGENKCYNVQRSLKCSSCGKERHKRVQVLEKISARLNHASPTWEETE
jgi:hypothetical protein